MCLAKCLFLLNIISFIFESGCRTTKCLFGDGMQSQSETHLPQLACVLIHDGVSTMISPWEGSAAFFRISEVSIFPLMLS